MSKLNYTIEVRDPSVNYVHAIGPWENLSEAERWARENLAYGTWVSKPVWSIDNVPRSILKENYYAKSNS